MKTLNLVDLDKSDIKYQHQKFPDGQQNIIIIGLLLNRGLGNDDIVNLEKNTIIQIKSRLNNWLDLELIICTVASLRELGVEEIHLYAPYIMGARSDRKFEEGGNNYLKDIICPVINSLGFKSVTCIDPHSYSLECCIKNFRSIDNSQLVKFALNQIYNEK
jgi:phosphoribosylpyrophosphate synthetase